MATPSTSASPFSMVEEDNLQAQLYSHHHQHSSSPAPEAQRLASAPPLTPPKKKRNLPGTPNPDAEVVALSPKTLMATNKFVCEVCHKGFQREQNLQLHRRGHNLPWKLRQKTTKEVKRKVYLCPEPTCVHHEPSRALGDLTGIKKHYSRKHGEKNYMCEKCQKRYAVQSDWKAHSKTCGTREYRCDCGTLFSRRDSFVTHRAFCDALTQESGRHPTSLMSNIGSHMYGAGNNNINNNNNIGVGLFSPMSPQIAALMQNHPSHTLAAPGDVLRLGGNSGGAGSGARMPSRSFDHLLPQPVGSTFRPSQPMPPSAFQMLEQDHQSYNIMPNYNNFPHDVQTNANVTPSAANLFNLGYFPSIGTATDTSANLYATVGGLSGTLLGDQIGSLGFSSLLDDHAFASSVELSATGLLQKAAQMGCTSSSFSPAIKSEMELPLNPVGYGGVLGVHDSYFNDLILSSLRRGGHGTVCEQDTAMEMEQPGRPQQQRRGPRYSNMEDSLILKQNVGGGASSSSSSIGGGRDDRMTRDFLGVGDIVRSMKGGGGGGGGAPPLPPPPLLHGFVSKGKVAEERF